MPKHQWQTLVKFEGRWTKPEPNKMTSIRDMNDVITVCERCEAIFTEAKLDQECGEAYAIALC